MRKLLLIKPAYTHIPIGMAYILGLLERESIPFEFIDLSRRNVDLHRRLESNDVLAVASGGLVADYRFLHGLIGSVKSARPDLPFILGGNVTNCLGPDLLFGRLGADFAIHGEAETSLPGLIDRLKNGTQDFEGLPGVAFLDRRDGSVRSTKPEILDLRVHDPKPAWHLIDHDFYLDRCRHHSFAPGGIFMPVLTGRGCAGRCSFCNPTLGRFRPRTMEGIFQEMRDVDARYHFDAYNFATEVFFAKGEDIQAFCEQYRQQGFTKPWFCSLRLDVGPEVLRTMKNCGCIGVSIGFESASDRMLKLMRKGITAAQGLAFVQEAKRLNLPLECNIMAGNEDETAGDLQASFDMLRSEMIDCNINLTIAYPGTAIFHHAQEKGLIGETHGHAMDEAYPGLYNPDIVSMGYTNISAFESARDLHDTVMRLYREWTRAMLASCRVRPRLEMRDDRPFFGWECPHCGQVSDIHASNRQFDGVIRRRSCPGCASFHYVDMLPLGLRRALANILEGKRRPLLLGEGPNARSVWAYAPDGLDHEAVVGVAAPEVYSGSNRKFFFKPRLSLEEGAASMPDVIVSLDRSIDYDRAPMDALYPDGAPSLVPLTPNLFLEEAVRGRKVVFLGEHPANQWLRHFIEEVPGAEVAGTIGRGFFKTDKCSDPGALPLMALFTRRWDCAVMSPSIWGGSFFLKALRFAAFTLVLLGKRPVLRREFTFYECISWTPWRREEVLKRCVDFLAGKLKVLIPRF